MEYDELENEECVLSYVSFCTQKAKKIFSKYNDVVWVDSKYGTNKYGMRLINFTIPDAKGKNRIVFTAFTKNEEKSTFKKILKDFNLFHAKKPIVPIRF